MVDCPGSHVRGGRSSSCIRPGVCVCVFVRMFCVHKMNFILEKWFPFVRERAHS